MEKEKFFKESWVSVAMLCEPEIIGGEISKGVLIINQVDPIIQLFPRLKDLFFIVERHGWFGPNEATMADIVLLEDQTYSEQVRRNSPNSVHLEIGPADFIDHNAFYPTGIAVAYDAIQISCWSRRKRIELFIRAAATLPHLRFVHLGHYENGGNEDELSYRDECINLAAAIAPNLEFPFTNSTSNEQLPNSKAEINHWINRSKIGVLTTIPEGINRFKMECLSADRPCLVPVDSGCPTQKHINKRTGMLFSPDVEGLNAAIQETLLNQERFKPREYLLACTGKKISEDKLKEALKSLCRRAASTYRYESISWDGRNESLLWGKEALDKLNKVHQIF